MPHTHTHTDNSQFWLHESIKDRRFQDHYDLGKELGRGATSVVYKCFLKGSDQAWAVKVLDKRVEKKAIKKEAGILMKLNHQNIVRMKEVFETPDYVYMCLELVTGGELFERIVDLGFYSEKVAANAVKDIISAVEYLHSHDIVHRDLKPENILCENLSVDSKLKVSDFGMSTIVANNVQLVTVCGTPAYCAPEVLRGDKYGKNCDMWSVGVIAYILLCGYEPFFHEKDDMMFKKILKADYKFDSPWWDEISENAKDFVSKLLVVDPAKRLSATAALKHVWVAGIAARNADMETTKEKIREFNARRKMKFAMDALVAVTGATRNMPFLEHIMKAAPDNDEQSEQDMQVN